MAASKQELFSKYNSKFLEAVCEGNIKVIEETLNNGANIEAKNNVGMTGVYLAIRYEQPEALNYLLERGANVEATIGGCHTPLMDAARFCHFDMVDLLLKAGASPEKKDSNGETALNLLLQQRGLYIYSTDEDFRKKLHDCAERISKKMGLKEDNIEDEDKSLPKSYRIGCKVVKVDRYHPVIIESSTNSPAVSQLTMFGSKDRPENERLDPEDEQEDNQYNGQFMARK